MFAPLLSVKHITGCPTFLKIAILRFLYDHVIHLTNLCDVVGLTIIPYGKPAPKQKNGALPNPNSSGDVHGPNCICDNSTNRCCTNL